MKVHQILIAVRDRKLTVAQGEDQLNRLIEQKAAERAFEREREAAWNGHVDRQGGAFDDYELLDAYRRREEGY